MPECVGHYYIEGSDQTIYTFFYSSEGVFLLCVALTEYTESASHR
jgi:hypothetical protein